MKKDLEKIVFDLRDTLNDITAALVLTIDGVVLASSITDEQAIDEIGATAAAMQSLGNRSTSLLKRGDLQQIQIHASNGFMILNEVNADTVLIALTVKKPNMGLVLHEIKRAVSELLEIIK